MKITRRTVLRLTGAAAASLALSSCSEMCIRDSFGAALGFNDRQRQAVLAHQHIVRIALLLQHAVHVVHFVLGAHIGIRPGEFPAHGLEIDVDDLLPRLGLGQVGGGETAALPVLLFAGRVRRRKA